MEIILMRNDDGTRAKAARHSLLRSARVLAVSTLSVACVALMLAGCETGRTNKTHAAWQHVSDDTTTSKPESHQALGSGDHQPPVPGSPTAAGPDGNQPPDDMQARSRHGNEHGQAAAPFAQPADSPERH